MGVVATIPEQFRTETLRVSDFAFLDGFRRLQLLNCRSPVRILEPCRPKAGKVVRQMETICSS